MKKKARFYKITPAKIAEVKGVTVHAVYQATKRGKLDISDLESICRYIRHKKGE